MKFSYGKVIGIFVGLCLVTSLGLLYLMNNSPDTVKIGFSAGLTGVKSELGVNGRNGVLLAVEITNQQGGIKGRKIELLIADDKNDKTAAVEADKYLVEQGSEAIIGHMTSGMAELTVPFANVNNILLISPTISTDELTGIDDHFVRVVTSNAVQGGYLAEAATKITGIRKFAIIYDASNDSFARPIITTFGDKLQSEGGGILLTESFESQGDFGRLVRSVQQSDVEGILLIASAMDAATFCQQGRKLGINMPIFLPMWAMTNDFIITGGTTVDGAYLINQEDLNAETAAYRGFRQMYLKRYGMEPTFAALMSYDAAMVLFEGMMSATEMSPEGIKTAIVKKGTFQGLQQEIKIDRYGDATGRYYLYRVQEGAFVRVGQI